MGPKRYRVVFSGKLVEGATPSQVLARLCDLLQQDEQEVRALFKSGTGAVVFDDLTNSQAYARQEDLRGIGVIASVREMPAPPPLEPLSGSMMTMGTPEQARKFPPLQRPVPAEPPRDAGGGAGLVVKLALLAALAGAGWWGYQKLHAPVAETPAGATQAPAR